MTPASLIISPREPIAHIVDRALLLDARQLVIILPEDADVAQSLVSLKIIHQELTESGIEVTWKSTSSMLQKVLDKTFTTSSSMPDGDEEKNPNNQAEEPKPKSHSEDNDLDISKEVEAGREVENTSEQPKLAHTVTKIAPMIEADAQSPSSTSTSSINPISEKADEDDAGRKSHEPRVFHLMTRKRAFIFAIAALLIGLGSFIAISPRAEITIIPVSEPFVVDLEVAATPSPGPDDISLRWKEIHVSTTDTIDATGKKIVSTKAEGSVSFSNIYSTTAIVVPSGAILTDDRGEKYVLSSTVTVPGETIVGPKRDPGVATGKIVAETAGEKGNRGAGSLTMSYPGYDSASAADFTATTSGLSGGTEEEKTIVSAEDLQKLREMTTQSFLGQILTDIEPERQPNETILPSGWIVSSEKTEISAKEGDETPSVTSTRTATVSAGLFNPDEAQRALNLLLERRRGQDRLFINPPPFGLKLVVVDTDRKRLIVGWHVDTLVSAPIDQDAIKERVLGKDIASIEALSHDDSLPIKRISARFWPFWVKNAPRSLKRIEIKIEPS